MGGPGGAAFASAAHSIAALSSAGRQVASASRSFCRMLPAVLSYQLRSRPMAELPFQSKGHGISRAL